VWTCRLIIETLESTEPSSFDWMMTNWVFLYGVYKKAVAAILTPINEKGQRASGITLAVVSYCATTDSCFILEFGFCIWSSTTNAFHRELAQPCIQTSCVNPMCASGSKLYSTQCSLLRSFENCATCTMDIVVQMQNFSTCPFASIYWCYVWMKINTSLVTRTFSEHFLPSFR
jgi:hypothetical protein